MPELDAYTRGAPAGNDKYVQYPTVRVRCFQPPCGTPDKPKTIHVKKRSNTVGYIDRWVADHNLRNHPQKEPQ